MQPEESYIGSLTREKLRVCNCLVSKPGCLSSANQVLKAWRIPGELVVFRLCWNAEESIWILVKEYFSNSIDELACQSEGKQAKSKVFFFYVILPRLMLEGAIHI